MPFQVVEDPFLSLQVNGDRSSDLAFEAVTSVVAPFRDPRFAFYLSHAETFNKYNYSGDPKSDPSKSFFVVLFITCFRLDTLVPIPV